MSGDNRIIIPEPNNESFQEYNEKCNEASKYFSWVERKQKKFRMLMDFYPLFTNRNEKIIKRLKKDLPEMDEKINPLRNFAYSTLQAPKFDYSINNQIVALFATQHHSNFILARIRIIENDYEDCIDNLHKIIDENKYFYNKNVSFLSIGIAILSILIALFTVFSGIFIETNLHFSIF